MKDYIPTISEMKTLHPLGSYTITIRVGDIGVTLNNLSKQFHTIFSERYAPFIGEEADGAYTVEVLNGKRAEYLHFESKPIPYRMEQVWDGELMIFSTYYAGGFWDDKLKKGKIAIATFSPSSEIMTGIENYLRNIYAIIALSHKGFLLHSAGLEKDGRAYLFFGPSGSGKSTTASLSEGMGLLSDDLVLLYNKGDDLYATTTPFIGTLSQMAKINKAYMVASFFRLKKDTEVSAEKLSPPIAAGHIFTSCPFISYDSPAGKKLMENVLSAVERVPSYILHFRKDPSFWDLIEGLI